MLRTFTIQNYRSILETKVSLDYAEGKAPPHGETVETLPFLKDGDGTDNRVVPILAVYGANASGKSNLVSAFKAFQTLLCNGVEGVYQPNKLNRRFDTGRFCAEAALPDGTRCLYEIAYNEREIVSETLVRRGVDGGADETVFRLSNGADGDGKPVRDFAGVVTESYPAKRLAEAARVECSDVAGRLRRPFLWCLVHSYGGLLPLAVALWNEVVAKVNVFFGNEFFVSQGIDLLAGEDTDAARQRALGEILALLRKFDFGIQHLSLLRQKVTMKRGEYPHAPKGAIFCQREKDAVFDQITSRHVDADGNLVPFNFMTEESDGTKVIAGLLGVCLWAMKNGRTIVVDELDRSLHPLVLVALVSLFKSRRYNVANGQLVFTLHDPTLLDENMMRISEVGIVDKTLKDGTTVRRLSDYDGVRNVVNFRRQYLGGAYHGIPFPYI